MLHVDVEKIFFLEIFHNNYHKIVLKTSFKKSTSDRFENMFCWKVRTQTEFRVSLHGITASHLELIFFMGVSTFIFVTHKYGGFS